MRLGGSAAGGEDGSRQVGRPEAPWRVPRRLARVLLGAALGVAFPHAAAAEGSIDQCMQSYEAGQRLRREGELLGAAAELLVCGGPACPVRMQGDCQRWLDDVERATPAVVFRVRDARGTWLAQVSASIDGAAPRRLEGRALAMNPGEHFIVFEREGYRPLRTHVIVAEGEKLERRVITLEALPPSAERPLAEASELAGLEPVDALEAQGAAPGEQPGERWPAGTAEPGAPPASVAPAPSVEGRSLWGPLALGAVAVAGGVGFAYFGVRAQSGEADLEQCTPNCTQARVDDVKDDYLRSNVSLGIGLAGLVGAGLWLLLDRPEALDEGPHAGRAHGRARSRLGLGPTPYWRVTF
jgi:hypothetical protein